MARLPRLAVGGELHHLVQRGHRLEPAFRDDADRQAFVDALRETALAERVAIHGYALLDAEVQLLATPQAAEGLSRLMQALGRRYGAAFNRRHGHAGTVWAGRYRAGIVEPAWAARALRVIETAPVRAGLVPDAGAWRFGSAAHHLGLRHDAVLSGHAAYWSRGNTPFERELAWRRFLDEPIPADELHAVMAAAEKGWVLGAAAYAARIAERSGRPAAPRRPGRPSAAGRSVPD